MRQAILCNFALQARLFPQIPNGFCSERSTPSARPGLYFCGPFVRCMCSRLLLRRISRNTEGSWLEHHFRTGRRVGTASTDEHRRVAEGLSGTSGRRWSVDSNCTGTFIDNNTLMFHDHGSHYLPRCCLGEGKETQGRCHMSRWFFSGFHFESIDIFLALSVPEKHCREREREGEREREYAKILDLVSESPVTYILTFAGSA